MWTLYTQDSLERKQIDFVAAAGEREAKFALTCMD
jgi:hypothetical protein